ncbi:MAG: hypothetical protein IIW21_00485 [Clostridia bacterium]|nr:hypothetical protein [Clostridia bacterium]
MVNAEYSNIGINKIDSIPRTQIALSFCAWNKELVKRREFEEYSSTKSTI